MKKNILRIIFLFSLINLIINKKKKHKKESKRKLKNGLPIPEDVRPNYVTPELFCETCRAIVKEAIKELRTKTKESDILYYLDNVCDESKYTIYQYVPRDIRLTCGVFMNTYQDELIKFLTKRKIDATKEELAYQLCDNITEICKGVEVNILKHMTKIDKNANTTINSKDGDLINIQYHKTNDTSEKKEKRKKKKKNNKKNSIGDL